VVGGNRYSDSWQQCPTTITFPANGKNLTQLQAALQAVAGVNPGSTTVNQAGVNPNNGQITITAASATDVITVTESASGVLTALGLTNPTALPTNQTVFGIDEATFIKESVAGGSITAYDGVGAPVNMQFRWAKVDSAILGGSHVDQWNLFYQVNSNPGTAQPAWLNAGTNFTFDATGQLNPPVNSLTLNNVTVDSIVGNVSVAGSGGITQFANSMVRCKSTFWIRTARLRPVAIGCGRRSGSHRRHVFERTDHSARRSHDGEFQWANYLKRLDGGTYAETADSGPAILNATGKIVGSSLEASNSDIADEFSKLIVTQQAYSANTRIITTTNAMVQDLLNVIR
jgi:flagellar hook protein FlgE